MLPCCGQQGWAALWQLLTSQAIGCTDQRACCCILIHLHFEPVEIAFRARFLALVPACGSHGGFKVSDFEFWLYCLFVQFISQSLCCKRPHSVEGFSGVMFG
jgi:hypothetical protein